MTMWSRSGGGKTPSKSIDETCEFFWERVAPVAEQQPGFKNALLFRTHVPGDTAIVRLLSLWASKAEMEAAEENEDLKREMDKFVSLFAEPLPIEHYETQLLGPACFGGIELDVHASCCPEGDLSLKWSAT